MNIWELSTNLHKRQESPWPPTIPYGGPKGSPIVFLAGLSPKWWHQFYLLPIFQNNQHVYFTIFMRRQNRYLFKRPTTKWKEKFKIISIKWKLEMEWAIVEDMDWVCINQIIWKVCRKIIVDLSIDLWHFHKRALFVLESNHLFVLLWKTPSVRPFGLLSYIKTECGAIYRFVIKNQFYMNNWRVLEK